MKDRNTKNKTRRFLALALTFAMLTQQTSIGATEAAEEISTQEIQTLETETSQKDAKDETAAEYTQTEPTEAAYTPIPANEAGTEPPVTEAGSEAATELLATEIISEATTEPLATEAISEAATESLVTEAVSEVTTEPLAMEAISEAATEAVSEAATEPLATEAVSEMEAAQPMEFTYENGAMSVTASLSAPGILPAGAVFVVKKETLNEEEKRLLGETLGDNELMAACAVYDMHFEVNGVETEPQGGSVSISIRYKNQNGIKLENKKYVEPDAINYSVYHLTDDQSLEDVTDSVNADGSQVNEVGFTTDSFSKFILRGIAEADEKLEEDFQIQLPEIVVSAAGKKIKEGEFTVSLSTQGWPVKTIKKSTDAEGKIHFEPIALKELFPCGNEWQHTHELTIKEEKGALAGMTYDETIYKAVITVRPLDASYGQKKMLVSEVTYQKQGSGEALEEGAPIAFQNAYQPVAYELPYTLENFLNGYNVISFGDAALSIHCLGAVLTGGNFTGQGFADGDYLPPSYIAGKLENGVFNSRNHANNEPLYVGSSNTVTVSDDGQYYVNDIQQGGTPKTPAYISDQYFSFARAKSAIISSSIAMAGSAKETLTPENGLITVQGGSNVTISSLEGVSGVLIQGQGDAAANTVINVTAAGDVTVPNEWIGAANEQFKGDETGNGTSIVWNFPYASSVTLPTQNWGGHVVAPNADVRMNSGNYGGAIIGKTVNLGAEGHLWSYRGDYLIDTYAEIIAEKTVDGAAPAKNEQFRFTLTQLGGPAEILMNPITVQNDGSEISFGQLGYSAAGTYFYRIEEAAEETADAESEYDYDVTKYLVEITVSAEIEGENLRMSHSEPVYYKIAKDGSGTKSVTVGNTVYSVTEAGAAVFDNRKKTDETSVSGTKTWNAPEGVERPRVTVELYRNGEKIAETPLTDDQYSFTGLSRYDESGQKYVYTVKEVMAGAAADLFFGTQDGSDFTNTYVTASLRLNAQKVMEHPQTKLGTFAFELKDANGNVKQTAFNDETGAVTFDALQYTLRDAGKTYSYTVSERIPDEKGVYLYDRTVYTVTVNVTGNGDGALGTETSITKDGQPYTETMKFVNGETSVKFEKTDPQGSRIAGARLAVKDDTGAVAAEWTTDGEEHDLTGVLETGRLYTLEETKAPAGYAKSAPVSFTVSETGETLVNGSAAEAVVMTDEKLHLRVNKEELGSDKEVDGAELILLDENGNVIAKWLSKTGEIHDFGDVIEAGKTYILREAAVPDGYEAAKDITFTVGEDGSIVTEAETAADAEGNTVYLMRDGLKPESSTGSIEVTKKLTLLDGTAIGMENATFYVALFADAAKTQRISEVRPIVFDGTQSGTVKFENLGKGVYYVGETDENGTPLDMNLGELEGAAFEAVFPDGGQVTLADDNASGQLEFTNQFYGTPGGYLYTGELQITKKVMLGSEPQASEDTFYAGVFYDAEYTELYTLAPLDMNGGDTVTETIRMPLGEDPQNAKYFYVTETDGNGTPLLNGAELEFTVSVDHTEVSMSGENPVAKVTITNTFGESQEIQTEIETEMETEIQTEIETEMETETETEYETEPATETKRHQAEQTSENTAPRTGDDTDYMLYLALMAMSAGVTLTAFAQKRKTRKSKK